MVERPSSQYRPVSLRHCTGRLADGDRVPQRPTRPQQEITRSEWLRILGAVVVVVALALLIRALR